MKRYKALNNDLTSPFQGFEFELNKEYVCNNFDENPNNECSDGFYATDIEGITYSYNYNRKIFECEVSGRSVEVNQYKMRYEKMTILKEVDYEEIRVKAKEISEKLGYNLELAIFPVNPLKNKVKPTKKHKVLLKEWDSVRASVGASVWASVRDSVGASVWASVWASVGDSVGASVGDSVRAYCSSIFWQIQDWKYIKHKSGKNPYQSCIDLWNSGLVPSFDGKVWRLHSGEKADVVFEITKEDLKNGSW